MRYYVFYVNKSASGEHRQDFAFDTRDGAIQKYHDLFATAMAGTVINYVMVAIINSAGGTELIDVWERTESE